MTSTKAFALLAAALVLAACGNSTEGAAPASSASAGAGTMSPAAASSATPSASTATATATPSPSASAGAAALQAKEAVVEGVPAVPVKVLIVDDSRAFRLILTRVLRQAGYDAVVTEAATGEEGLAQLDGQQFDLILSDWNMPGMGGLGMLEKFREGGRQEPFVLFVTTEWTEEQRSTAQAAGANGFLSKPFTPEALHQLLSGIL